MAEWQILHGDARTIPVATGAVSLLLCDPPYYRVKRAAWDRQWDDPATYLRWLGLVADEWARVLSPNGSLYVFAAPRMAARVELLLAGRFNVLNSITWQKPPYSTKAEMSLKEDKRRYFEASERVIFCEQYGSNGDANWSEAETALKRSIMGAYLDREIGRAGVSRNEIAALFPSATGGMTGCVSNWTLGYNMPTPDQYAAIRERLNRENGNKYLRKEYEELRKEYEELRRPFYLTNDAQYTDVWDFDTVHSYPGKHECEKPQNLLRHIIRTSSSPGDLVLDTFAGGGSAGVAAIALGRRFLGIERSRHWAQYAMRRLAAGVQLPLLDTIS